MGIMAQLRSLAVNSKSLHVPFMENRGCEIFGHYRIIEVPLPIHRDQRTVTGPTDTLFEQESKVQIYGRWTIPTKNFHAQLLRRSSSLLLRSKKVREQRHHAIQSLYLAIK